MLDDVIGPAPRLLFVGVNPATSAVATHSPFSHPSNRFFPALARAGITDHLIDTGRGLAAADREHLFSRGVGITALVRRATPSAAELTTLELTAAVQPLPRRRRRGGGDSAGKRGVAPTAASCPRAGCGGGAGRRSAGRC